MPKLIGLTGPFEKAPGFLLPVFQAYPGANYLMVQEIDAHDMVADFVPAVTNGAPLKSGPVDDVEVEAGHPAIWAYHAPNGLTLIGNAHYIRSQGTKLLQEGHFKRHPLAGAELASFCDVEADFPELLLEAFGSLEKISKDSAATWRDTMVLTPAIRKDFARTSRRQSKRNRIPSDIVAVSHRNTTVLYYSGDAAVPKTFSTWQELSVIFGITELEIHETPIGRPTARKVDYPAWVVVGFGGIANFVIQRPPFNGGMRDPRLLPGGAIARGAIVPSPMGRRPAPLLIGIISSDYSAADRIKRQLDIEDPSGAIRHVINVRPIGYGTPSPSKAPAARLLQGLPGVQRLWIVATHRLKQTGRYANSMSATNRASRFVRAATQALISTMSDDTGAILGAPGDPGQLGVVGAARYDGRVSAEEMIVRVLSNMLCEDVYLESAQRIVIFGPYALYAQKPNYTVRLGRHDYEVELYPHSTGGSAPDQVGFALGVKPSHKTARDFEDFCVALLSGYGWRERHADGGHILFENEGEVLGIWAAPDVPSIQRLLSHDSDFGPQTNLVITNRSVTAKLRDLAEMRKWTLIHYSEIDRWMRSQFGVSTFQDW